MAASESPDTQGAPRGAVLAGGRGSRLGGAKPTTDLAGKPLIAYPLAALAAAGLAPFVVAKPASEVGVEEVEIVTEPAEPTHPLTGIVAALRHAGCPLIVLGCDFPFVPPGLLRALAEAPGPLVVPAPGGDAQPLVARWDPALLGDLEAALAREEPLRRTVASLDPRLLDDAELAMFGDPSRILFNVNTSAELQVAAELLGRGG